MKTTKNLVGGKLRKDAYSSYADYFIKYIQAYKAKGNIIYAVTPQNEPLYVPWNYPGLSMSADEQKDFIGNYLGPKFKKAAIKTKIVAYDHNYDNIDYVSSVCADQNANNYISGAGFHHYVPEGTEWNITTFKASFPDKEMWITEAGFGTWMGNDLEQFQKQMVRLIKTTRYWSKGK